MGGGHNKRTRDIKGESSMTDYIKQLKNKQIFLFLDYDGTIVPIKRTPKEAVLPQGKRKLLELLAGSRFITLAFVSGRSADDIKTLVKIDDAIYAGNHGFEIDIPGEKRVNIAGNRTLNRLRSAVIKIRKALKNYKGILIEDKKVSVSIHYRMAAKSAESEVEALLDSILRNSRNVLRIGRGKMVFEVLPSLKWDKGYCVKYLLNRFEKVHKKKYLPVFIGDDITDETAFKALRNRGLTFKVGKKRGSCAKYYFKSTRQVNLFLKRLVIINEQ